MCKIVGRWEAAAAITGPSSMLCDDPEGWDEGEWGKVEEGGDICVLVDDSCCCMVDANTIL